MKNKAFAILRAVLSSLLATAVICCPVTGLKFDFSLWNIILCATVPAALFAAFSLFLKRRYFIIATAAFFAFFALFVTLNLSSLMSQLNFAVNSALELYSIAYPFPQNITFADEIADSADFLISVLTVLCSSVITITVVRARRVLPAFILSLIIIAPSYVLVDTPPDTFAIVSSIVILLALFMTKFLIQNNVSAGAAVMLSSAALLSAAAIIICNIFPPENYKPFPWQEQIRMNWESDLGVDELSGRGTKVAKKSFELKDYIDLYEESGFHHNGDRVMRVLATVSGREYLRETCYGVYVNSRWELLNDYMFDFLNTGDKSPLFNYQTGDSYSLSVRTDNRVDYAYFPYNAVSEPNDLYPQYDICLANPYKHNEYTFEVSSGISIRNDDFHDNYDDFVSHYTGLPEDTYWYIEEYLLNNNIEVSDFDSDNVETVKSVVSNLARYSEDTAQCPQDREFVYWFLNEAQSGYCVHYATTAVCMLRYMGIPARYVSGFCVNTKAGEWVDVTDKSAHAWAEYYIPGAGWSVLEATPASYDPAGNEEEPTTQEPSFVAAHETQPAAAPLTTEPAANPTDINKDNPTDYSGLFTALKLVLIILAVAAALSAYVYFLAFIRKKKFKTGNPNKRAQNIYRYLKRLKKPVPEEAEKIALKSRFSQHTVSEDEIIILEKYYLSERSKKNKLLLLIRGL